MAAQTLKPDARGRVSLKRIAGSAGTYKLQIRTDGSIVISPVKISPASQKKTTSPPRIPAREKWLYENPIAREALEQGLKEAAEGKVKELGSFARYAV